MEPVSIVSGRGCPIDAADVDTDQIIPKQFLKRIDRTGFGPFAFYEWRYDEDGNPQPDFPMNRTEHAGANILVTGRNFGCGSSREHAPWALEDAGFEAIIAPSFADIFAGNCANIGVLLVELAEDEVRTLLDTVTADPDTEITVDLPEHTVIARRSDGTLVLDTTFDIDPHVKHRLVNGLDSVGLTLQHVDDIDAFEQRRPAYGTRIVA
jgi:3-isopropylmalate/(R)-2-methylmalate dehydratase small subunit